MQPLLTQLYSLGSFTVGGLAVSGKRKTAIIVGRGGREGGRGEIISCGQTNSFFYLGRGKGEREEGRERRGRNGRVICRSVKGERGRPVYGGFHIR